MTTPEMIDAAEANIRADHRAGKISKEQFQKELLIVTRARQHALVQPPAPPVSNVASAARAFMELFVAENGDERALTVDDIDHAELTHRYAALEAALVGSPAPKDHVKRHTSGIPDGFEQYAEEPAPHPREGSANG